MNFSKLLVTALVAASVNAFAQESGGIDLQPGLKMETDQSNSLVRPVDKSPIIKPAVIKLGAVTGVVTIKTPGGGTMTIKKGDPAQEIPAGSEVVVVSGDAVVESGGTIVKAGEGDTFTVNVGADGAMGVAVTGGSVAVTGANGKTVEVLKGETSAAKTDVVVAATGKKDVPESIAVDSSDVDSVVVTGANVSGTSAAQESSNSHSGCVETVSPSSPCP